MPASSHYWGVPAPLYSFWRQCQLEYLCTPISANQNHSCTSVSANQNPSQGKPETRIKEGRVPLCPYYLHRSHTEKRSGQKPEAEPVFAAWPRNPPYRKLHNNRAEPVGRFTTTLPSTHPYTTTLLEKRKRLQIPPFHDHVFALKIMRRFTCRLARLDTSCKQMCHWSS